MSRGLFILIALGVAGLAAAFYLGILDWGYWRSRTRTQVAVVTSNVTTGLTPTARFSPEQARQNARVCLENLRRIESAKRQAAAKAGVTVRDVAVADVLPFLGGKMPVCPSGGTYSIMNNQTLPQCSIMGNGTIDKADDHILRSF
jgi:hypothetical protein